MSVYQLNQTYQFKLALLTAHPEAYFLLRQEIFCQEQSIFQTSNQDEYNSIVCPIVAINDDNKVV